MSEDDESFTDLSGFIVPDSDSDDRSQQKKARLKSSQRPSTKSDRRHWNFENDQTRRTQPNDILPRASEAIDHSLPKVNSLDGQALSSVSLKPSPKRCQIFPVEPFMLQEDLSQLKFSPPKSRKPSKVKGLQRPTTPSSSFKSILDSPSKKHRIPPSPHRPSIDAFWSQDVINDWNDRYSPRKLHHTPGRNKVLTFDDLDDNYSSASISPPKCPTKSLIKEERQAARVFNREKAKLAKAFLHELDKKITNNQISSLTASTGGINIVWSKKLSSTAGRANWRREAVRCKNLDDTFSETTYKHHASIELAEKVINSEGRLVNVVAHEYCHLANFMISGIKDQPHGKEFKTWAAKVTHLFEERGVEVTTKHDYEISYKYVWVCANCALKYKRHSKSIDPTKHSCGSCKGFLTQVLPAPRKESEYQRFVKANWDRVKNTAGEDIGMGKINGLLAKEWEAKRVKTESGKQVVVEVAKIRSETGEIEDVAESPELVNVSRKLSLLNLEA